MSNLISIGTGDWLTAGTWGLVDTTSYLNSETGTTTVPNAAGASARSAAFTPGAITIDAIAVKLSVRTGTTGTLTVNLYNSTTPGDVAGTAVAINCSALQAATTAAADGGWIVFKLDAPVLLLAATNYMVQCVTSSATQIGLFRDATANNWSRMLRTTTTQAPTTGDDTVVSGEYTNTTPNSYTVTMNCTATTDHGSNTASSVTPALAVCVNGTLSYGTTSTVNYYLKLSGRAIIYNGGTMNIGTTGTPIPRDGTAVLEFDPAADGDQGLIVRNGSNLSIQGLSRTTGKNIVSCKLSANAAVNATSLTVDTDTGWLSGDQIVVASTTRTYTQSEVGTLNGNAGASSLTVNGFGGAGGGLAYAHDGLSPVQAEIINITRNVRIRSATSTLMSFVYIGTTSVVDIDWAEFYYIGANISGSRGIDVNTTTGSFSMNYSSIHDTEINGFYITGSSSNNITFSNNVLWNIGTSSGDAVTVPTTTGTSITLDSNVLIKTSLSSYGFYLSDVGITFTNNTVVSSGSTAIGFAEIAPASYGVFSGNTIHSCNSIGLSINSVANNFTFSNTTTWRNNSSGISITAVIRDCTFDTISAFGNVNRNIIVQSDCDFTVKNATLGGDTSFSTTSGMEIVNNYFVNVVLDNCDMSTVSGIKTAHTNDINVSTGGTVLRIVARNCKFGAATEVATPSNMTNNSFVSSQKHDQVAGSYMTYMRYGTLGNDTVIYNTASPSLRMTPTSAANKLESATQFRGVQVAVANTNTVTANVYTRKSSSGDGTAYTGDQPNLVLKANPAMGIATDTILATHSSSAGAWQKLTGSTTSVTDDGVLEFVVNAASTAGWVNVDDWSIG